MWQHQTPQPAPAASSQNGSNNSTTAKTDTFVYTPKSGGLSLTLAKTYEVIVNVDGNKGGAAGATFKVGTVVSDNVSQDNVYGWVQVDIDNISGTIDQQANTIKQQMQTDGYDNVKSVAATVDSKPAMLVTGDGHPYGGNKQVYVVRSGDFMYTITATGSQTTILDAVLKGLKLQAKTL